MGRVTEPLYTRDILRLAASIPRLGRLPEAVRRLAAAGTELPEGWEPGQPVLVQTTLGRCLFNEALPVDYPFVDAVVGTVWKMRSGGRCGT